MKPIKLNKTFIPMGYISFVILLCLSNILSAQNVISSEQLNPNAPQIRFTKTLHDFGNIKQNTDAVAEFEFKNVGKQPLILTDVRISCDCTVSEWPKQPILPGRTAVVKVAYDTKTSGSILRQVTVISNASNPSITLTITGMVN